MSLRASWRRSLAMRASPSRRWGFRHSFSRLGFLSGTILRTLKKKAFAPLLLLPVRVEAEKVRGHEVFCLSAREGAAEANLSLQKLLDKNFNRALPDLDTGE